MSNGHSPYWRDDQPKPVIKELTKEEQIIKDAFDNYVPPTTYTIYGGIGFIKAFDKALKDEVKVRYGI